jgi:thioredoxin 1
VNEPYSDNDPRRSEIDAIKGPLLLVFGSNSCSICRATEPLLVEALTGLDWLTHWKIQDGQGRKLGRTFAVKLWPTLIFIKNGKEIARLVRPDSTTAIQNELALLRAA